MEWSTFIVDRRGLEDARERYSDSLRGRGTSVSGAGAVIRVSVGDFTDAITYRVV